LIFELIKGRYDNETEILTKNIIIGLHDNVAVLDYNDEFANIINNISYETLTQQNESSLGILPNKVKQVLERRIHFRQLLNSAEASNCV